MRIRKRLYLPERIVFVIIFFILIIFGVQPSKAQPPFYPHNKPMLRSDGQDAYWKSSDLGLTETQKKTLENLQQAYASEAFPLRMELMSLRFELRYLLRSPNVQPEVLLDRQKKISEVQMKLDSLSFSYQMKARSVFTKEQLERLPEDCLPGMDKGYEMFMGIGRGPKRGLLQQGK
jgi:Spy/CpxP family protein refolding chaperone